MNNEIPKRKLEAIRALNERGLHDLLDEILAEHPAPQEFDHSVPKQRPRLAVLDEKLPSADERETRADAARLRQSLKSESDNEYPSIMLDDNTRVIECANSVQWIIQKRKGHHWRSTHFCRTKEGLLLYARPITPDLLALTDYFPARDRANSASESPPATSALGHHETRCEPGPKGGAE